jgi:hypothetical protein
MEDIPIRTVFGEITDFLATNPTPEEIVAYTLPLDLQSRAHLLLDKNSEGTLTSDEQVEMMDFARIENMMRLLKIKMRIKLKQQAHGRE